MAAFSNEVTSTLFLYFSGRLSVNYVSYFLFVLKEVLLFHYIVPVDNHDQELVTLKIKKRITNSNLPFCCPF